MKSQFIGTAIFLGAISGCISSDSPPETGGIRPTYGRAPGPPMVPGINGPYGTPVPMAAPYNNMPPPSQYTALRMLSANQPLNMVQMNPTGMPMGGGLGGMPNLQAPGNMLLSPLGVPGAPGLPSGSPFPPGGPGMPMPPMGGPFGPGGPGMPMPPMGGPFGPGGPGMPMPPMGNPIQKMSMEGMMPEAGMMNANVPPSGRTPDGVSAAQFANSSPVGAMFPAQRTQVYFGNPVRMKVYWYTNGADGKPNYSTTPLETPGRYNFAQGAIYRLKLTNIPGRPALELYPTLEVVPTSPKTNEFLAHNSVPVDFSEDDFKQVVDRNYIVKVIYLPDPAFQDAAGAGPGEITSAQLEPGQDPIQEALRRGSILLVLRIGNIDQGLISSPPTTAPIPSGPPMMFKPPSQGVPPGVQVPYNLPPITPGMPGAFAPGPFLPGPGGMPPAGIGAQPNGLPPLGPGATPPLFKVPLTAPPAPKPEPQNDAILPPLLPPPPGLSLDALKSIIPPAPSMEKPPPLPLPIPTPVDKGPTILPNPAVLPIPTPVEKGSSTAPTPPAPVIPTGASKETEPKGTPGFLLPDLTLPPLPAMDTGVGDRPSTPALENKK